MNAVIHLTCSVTTCYVLVPFSVSASLHQKHQVCHRKSVEPPCQLDAFELMGLLISSAKSRGINFSAIYEDEIDFFGQFSLPCFPWLLPTENEQLVTEEILSL